jgi:hypothetical protein
MTLSNPSGMQFTPASAPIVLRRVADKIPQLGFILSDPLDYESYRQELEAVAPAFGFFAAAPRTDLRRPSKTRRRRRAEVVAGRVKAASKPGIRFIALHRSQSVAA